MSVWIIAVCASHLLSLSHSLLQLPLGQQPTVVQGREQLGPRVTDERVGQEIGETTSILKEVEWDSDHTHYLGTDKKVA